MITYLAVVLAAVTITWAVLVLMIGRVLVRRPRRSRRSHAETPPSRPEPKKREDFTLAA